MAPGDLPRVLLGLARDDDFAARSLLPVEDVADAILGFHAQQAVEKSLKAVLASADVQFPYTHDLDGLIELCRGHGLEIPDALEDADQLSPYGVRMRYGASHDTRLDRDQALGWSAAAVEWAREIVERDDEKPAAE
jgi:HEPN domain-containing protein